MNYSISSPLFIMAKTEALSGYFWILRDKPSDDRVNVYVMFKDSTRLFRKRVKDMANLEIETTPADEEAMRIMLDVLFSAKRLLRDEE